MLRLSLLALVACASAAVPVGNHAASPPAHGEVWFPNTKHTDPIDQIDVMLTVDRDDLRLAGLVFSYDTGRITPITLSRAADDLGTGYYIATTRHARADDGDYRLAIVIPSIAMHSVPLAARDAAALDALRGDDIARVDEVGPRGLDLDGDRRADLAFMRVCGWLHPDGMCQGHYELLVRRVGDRWMPATMCQCTVACWAF